MYKIDTSVLSFIVTWFININILTSSNFLIIGLLVYIIGLANSLFWIITNLSHVAKVSERECVTPLPEVLTPDWN